MPRRARIHLPGVPQHVIQRGVDRQPVFFSDNDCLRYLEWLGEYTQKNGISLHAYCLMEIKGSDPFFPLPLFFVLGWLACKLNV